MEITMNNTMLSQSGSVDLRKTILSDCLKPEHDNSSVASVVPVLPAQAGEQGSALPAPPAADVIVKMAYHPLSGTKKGRTEGWNKVQPGQYQRTGCDGVNLGGCEAGDYQLGVFDYDIKRDLEPHQQLEKLYNLVPCLRLAPTAKTPSGGSHIYVLAPVDLKLKKDQPEFPAFDFLCAGKGGPGRNAVAPGSKTDKGEYILVQPGGADFDNLPLRCFPLVTPDVIAKFVQVQDATAGDDDKDDIETFSGLDSFQLICGSWEPAIQGHRGNDTTYKLACKGWDLGLPHDEIFVCLRDIYNPRCQPPWNDAELHELVKNARRYRQNSVGCDSPESRFPLDVAAPPESDPAGSAPAVAEITWTEPKEIKTELSPVPLMLPDMIPGPFRPWLSDIVRRMGVPLDFVAVAVVCVTGSVIGAACGIKPKRKDDWTVVPNLWGGVVAQPGQLKSPALEEALKPLIRLEKEAQALYDEALTEYKAREQSYEASKKAVAQAMRNAAQKEIEPKKGESIDQCEKSPSMGDLEKRLVELQPPQPPVWHRYKTNDATVPKLAELLKDNPRGLLVFRDELIGQLKQWDKPGNESDRAFFLEGWNGTGSHIDDRIGRGTTAVPNMCISLFGGIQPSKLLSYLYDAIKGDGNDGLVQRLQLLVYPGPTDWRLCDEYPDHKAKDRAFKIIADLASMDFAGFGANSADDLDRPAYHFNDAAQAYFNEWWTRLEMQKIKDSTEEPIIAEHLAKFRSLMPSLALIFHLIEIADAKTPTSPFGVFAQTADLTGTGTASGVPLHCAVMAANWCEYLEAHARRIYGLVANVADKAAACLADKIKKGKIASPFTLRDVYRKEWSLLHTKEQVAGACEDLIQAGWLQSEIIPPSSAGGRSTIIFKVNPALTRESADGSESMRATADKPLDWDDVK
jgi:hypothetical protein